jgi:hypothetical protein
MKKVYLAAFAGLCVMTSIMATSFPKGKSGESRSFYTKNDSVPGRKYDTSRNPKPDTASMPRIVDRELK